MRIFAAADNLRRVVGAPESVLWFYQEPYEQALASARAALSEDRFAAVWALGAALSLDEAIDGQHPRG